MKSRRTDGFRTLCGPTFHILIHFRGKIPSRMGSEHFYRELPSFSRFGSFWEDTHFATVPDDWVVVISDVAGSTKAIEEGRYKDVNTVGAASLVCVSNHCGGIEMPMVFGGDGATMLFPASMLEEVGRELLALKVLSQEKFGLELRVGAVPVSELKKAGKEIRVAKFELDAGKCVALFKGGGVTLAENLVKKKPEEYSLESKGDEARPNLQGLSCRWKPIPSRSGVVLSLLVVAQEGQEESYSQIAESIARVFSEGLESANPIHIEEMEYRSFRDSLSNERRFHQSSWSPKYWFRVLEIALAVLIFRLGVPPLFFNAKRYARSMATHSDFRKFDDALRMIVDCTEEQASAIAELLESMQKNGAIYYGIHQSPDALMTCYVQGLKDGQHIHFVDGGNGGYAMAAKQLKAQMAEKH